MRRSTHHVPTLPMQPARWPRLRTAFWFQCRQVKNATTTNIRGIEADFGVRTGGAARRRSAHDALNGVSVSLRLRSRWLRLRQLPVDAPLVFAFSNAEDDGLEARALLLEILHSAARG